MTDSVFVEDPIEFYSQRMKKTFGHPDFQMSLTLDPSQKTGKDKR